MDGRRPSRNPAHRRVDRYSVTQLRGPALLIRLATLVTALALVHALMPVPIVSAATTLPCPGDDPPIHGGVQKQAGGTLTLVRSFMEKQGVPLCTGPGTEKSASSWWIMIFDPPATDNAYIQYGFWKCQSWCNFGFPGGGTNGEVHEFLEWNDRGGIGGSRVDLGDVANGMYNMKIIHTLEGVDRFEFWRGSNLKYTVNDDGWRNWSLWQAIFGLQSETWDLGDQNGGEPGNPVRLERASWGITYGPLQNISMPGCFWSNVPAGQQGNYQCAQYGEIVNNDSIKTWTLHR